MFSYPGTKPFAAAPKTRQVRTMTDNVQIFLAEGSRSFPNNTIVALSDFEYAAINPTVFGTLIEDRGSYAAIGDDAKTREITFVVQLATVVNGVVRSFVPDYAGSIVSWHVTATDPVITAAKTTTFGLAINGVAVTGATLVWNSAAATPEGALVEGGAITATNTFVAGNTITLTAASTTAFVEGEATVQLAVVAV